MFITEAFVEDRSGAIKAVWFNQPYLANTLKEGLTVSLSGKVSFDKNLYLSNPAYEKISPPPLGGAGGDFFLRHTGRLVPVYPETAGLTSRYLRYLISLFLPALAQLTDWLPLEVKKSQRLIDLPAALRQIHFPSSTRAAEQAKRRLAFEELFLLQTFVLTQRVKWQQKRAIKISFNERLIKDFVAKLPFKLTQAQRQAAWEILQDLAKPRPMNRLLEGDVGSGKTVVAAIAALEAARAGWQVALMAPTEILARQHFQTLNQLLSGHNLKVCFLSSSETKQNAKEAINKKSLLAKIKSGQINIVVGTHALIQQQVSFKNLALAIVDEQHRFGVMQRAALQKNITLLKDGLPEQVPHLLSMTATPIPRTLALTIYGDLELSLLNEMPKGRPAIITKIVPPTKRTAAYDFIRQEIKAGRQAFVICPRIELPEENNQDEIKAVKEEYRRLSQEVFPDLKLTMLHGKLKPVEKAKVMADFSAGRTDILVSTSVVEVGIDIPNATVMMIEGAERFGLAQLHQFRGRVGRGPHQSYCLLFTDSSSQTTQSRLKALVTCRNGFELAEKDLALRGPGQFFGTSQSGLPDLPMASLIDMILIKQARTEAAKILQQDPELKKYPLLKDKLKKFQTTIHLE